MARSKAEIQDIIRDVKQPFQELYNRQKTADSIVRGTIADEIRKNLPDVLDPKAVVVDRAVSWAARQFMSAMRKPYEVYIEPHSSVKRDETRSDDLEDILANRLLRFDPNGWLLDDVNYHLATKPYGAVWLEHDEWKYPDKDEGESSEAYTQRKEQYRETWFGWSAEVLPYDTVAFLERSRVVSLGVQHFKLPVVEIVKRFGGMGKAESKKDEAEMMAKIGGQRFAFLRAGAPYSPDGGLSDSWNQEYEVMIVSDGRYDCVYVKADRDADGRYNRRSSEHEWEEIREVETCLGRPSLFLAYGAYHAHEPIQFKYEPYLYAMIGADRNVASILSMWASKAMNMPVWGQELPPEVALAVINAGQEVPATVAVEHGRMMNFYGKPWPLNNPLDPTADKLYAEMKERLQHYMPSAMMSNIDQDTLAKATAAAVLGAIDIGEREIEEPVKSVAALLRDMLEATLHFDKQGLNAHRKKGDKSEHANDVGLYARLRGSENARHGKVEAGWKELRPQDIDFDYSIEVFPRNENRSARAAEVSQALEIWAVEPKIMHYDEVLDARGITNKTEHKKKVVEETLHQLDAPGIVNDARERRRKVIAIRHGTPWEQVMMSNPGQAMGGDTGGNATSVGGGGNFTSSPAVNEAQASAAGLGGASQPPA